MIDFVGRTTSVVDEAAKWGNYFGEIDNRAQRRWMDREARQRYDEENRYQLERAQSTRDAYAGRAGLFTGADASFGDMEMRNEPAAQVGPMNITPPTGGGLTTLTEPQAQITTNTPTQRSGTGSDQAYRPQHPTNLVTPLTPRDMTREQSRAWFQYVNATRRYNMATGRMDRMRNDVPTEEFQRHIRNLREVGIELRNGQPVSVRSGHLDPADPGEYSQFVWPGNLPEDGVPVEDQQTNANTDNQATAPANGPGSPTYRGEQDTSGTLQPTPEMRMIETVMQDNLRLANIAARHGRNTEAEQHFAQALQSQAALLQQSRLLMLRAGAQGHRSALADLIGLYSGRPNGTTHIVEAGDGRFHIEVDTRDGRRTATANPLTMDELFSRAEYLVDRESVAARSEANSEIIRANIAAGAQIRVAQINAMSSREEQIVRAAIANADNQTRERIARGDVDFVVDSTNNRAYLRSFEPGPNGEMQPVITEISPQEVQVPSVDGNQTEQQMVGRRVTGVAGLRTN